MSETDSKKFVAKTRNGGTANGNVAAATTKSKSKGHHSNIWLPDQPGAWVMALFPALGGIVIGGVSWRNVWLLVAWTLCYCFQFSAARWLGVRSHEAKDAKKHRSATGNSPKKRHSNVYFVPAAAYLVATAIVGIPVFVFAPKLLWWIPAYAILAVLSFVTAWLRRERTLWGNAVAVIAAGGMALLAASLGSRFFASVTAGEGLSSRLSPISHEITSGSQASSAYFLGSPLLPKAGVIAAIAFILTEYASVVFVKTMFRKYGRSGYYALSVVYHVALAALGFATPMLLRSLTRFTPARGVMAAALLWGIAATVLLLIAIVLPHHKRMKAMQVGGIEAFTSLMNLVVIVVALA
ncbi:YwiC-like family protein [Bifidobacterium sp. ESL0790]|uniref:YwiC-like family protein n=1 Tax=Bifidobacterium sp. ESL0790 TaxID=2983233 RepID=UPI0023F6D9EC|nr:YwiC-like family protein [Bifidobacterium sp. ESL0790]WEV72327.1 YwiC-like family protein [Bifidobacterium sp. ESL0790]